VVVVEVIIITTQTVLDQVLIKRVNKMSQVKMKNYKTHSVRPLSRRNQMSSGLMWPVWSRLKPPSKKQ